MIQAKELNKKGYMLTKGLVINLNELLAKMNIVRAEWGKPMIVTSGLRSRKDQEKINPAHPYSRHLTAQACDIADPDGSLGEWVKANVSILESAGLWCEDPEYTKGWVHFQSAPPKSGKRFFIP